MIFQSLGPILRFQYSLQIESIDFSLYFDSQICSEFFFFFENFKKKNVQKLHETSEVFGK